jgi:phosphoglycolate phosphatase-like HAD superfamily hydrolase
MLGDTPYDVEAAKRAGIEAIAVRYGGLQDSDLQGCLAVYNDPADLLAHYDASPLAKAG